MNKVSGRKRAANPGNGPRNRLKLCKPIVLGIIMIVWVGVSAQTPPAASKLEQSSQQKKTPPGIVKSYVCPMHPDVKSTKRGKCPKCGMGLQLVRVDTNSAGPANANLIADNAGAEAVTTGANSATYPDGPGPTRKMVIPDVEVLDQNGNRVQFYSDLIKGKTVAINFIFTNCTTICPPLAATFARVQKEMGEKAGRDVHFISISVDPLTDTPERLKAWGAKFRAGVGWTFVTGNKEEIDKLLNALGASVARREDHSPTVIVGNDLTGVWTRTYGLARTAQMVGLILNVMEGKTDESVTKEMAKP